MSLLRELYGSCLPQSRYPRSNEQVNSYWEEDTKSAREMAQLMEEEENDSMSKRVMPAISTSVVMDRPRNMPTFEPLQGLCVDITNPLPQTPLSPSGIISIAAADIDEAARNEMVQSPYYDHHGHLNIDALRQTCKGSNTAIRQVLVEDITTRILTRSHSAVPVEMNSSSRFLTLLRRVYELQAQQLVQATSMESGGLPYPQIQSLPTFAYTERTSEQSNTICTICCTEYQAQDIVRALPCLHFYHYQCIDTWLMENRRCPLCSQIVTIYL